MAELLLQPSVEASKSDHGVGLGLRSMRRRIAMAEPVEALLLRDREDEERLLLLAELESSREA